MIFHSGEKNEGLNDEMRMDYQQFDFVVMVHAFLDFWRHCYCFAEHVGLAF